MNEDPPDDSSYDLAPEPSPIKVKSPAAAPAVVLGYRSPRVEAAAVDATDVIRDFKMPIWLLGGGIVIEVVARCLREQSVLFGLAIVGVEVVLGTAILLAGVILAAKWRQIDLGPVPRAAFKLAAISVAPAAAVDLMQPLLNFIPFGGLIGWGVSFVLYFALIGALFQLDESDTWFCVWTIFLVRLATYFAFIYGIRNWL